MTSEHTTQHATQHTPSDMSSSVSAQHPLAAAASALGELKHDAYTAACAAPSVTGCISAAFEQISQLQIHLDAQTRTARRLADHLRLARAQLTDLAPTVLQGENDAYKAYFTINRLAEQVRVANLQRPHSQEQEHQEC